MPRILATVKTKPALLQNGLLVRLIENEAEPEFYVSCHTVPWQSWTGTTQEFLEDYEFTSWKRSIPNEEARQWLASLRQQSITFVPELRAVQERDGIWYEFSYEAQNRKIQLSWDNEVPQSWLPIYFFVQWLLGIAGEPDETS